MYMKKRKRVLYFICALVTGMVSPALLAQTYTMLYNFNWHAEGANPNQPMLLAQGQDGSLNGTLQTQLSGDGSAFSYSLAGYLTQLYDFTGLDGNTPQSGLSLGMDGSFYGTTETGGPLRYGTVFKLGSGGMTVLYEFTDGVDGAYPWAPPVQALDGNIYGVTNAGTNPGRAYRIEISSSGKFSVIATLPSGTQAPLILGQDGNLYGTTPYGGTYNHGTVFKLTTAGKLTVIHSFNDGTNPAGPVMQGTDGKLYGTTGWGGTYGEGIVYSLTTSGTYKVLHNFQDSEGAQSTAGLVQSGNTLYGVAQAGGLNGVGTLFEISTTGTGFAVLHQFLSADGAAPLSTPVLHTNGTIYGTTLKGGSPNPPYGVLYSFSNGLPPFASLVVVNSAKAGGSVGILGQGFLTATGVNFGTSPAGSFRVYSDTYLVATSGAQAITGKITVLEPGGNLVSLQTYKIIPAVTSIAPTKGPAGTTVAISGQSLSQTTGVTFGNIKATKLTISSNGLITAIVPAGAKTGHVVVTTAGGKATSPGVFTVN